MQFFQATLGYQTALRLQSPLGCPTLGCHNPLGWSAGLNLAQPLVSAAQFQLNLYRQIDPIQFLSDWTQPDWSQSNWGEALPSIEELPVAELPVTEPPVTELPAEIETPAETPPAESLERAEPLLNQPSTPLRDNTSAVAGAAEAQWAEAVREPLQEPLREQLRNEALLSHEPKPIAQRPQQERRSTQQQEKSRKQPAKPKASQKANQKQTEPTAVRQPAKRSQKPVATPSSLSQSDELEYPVISDPFPLPNLDLESHSLENHSLEFFNPELDEKSDRSGEADRSKSDRFSAVESSHEEASTDTGLNSLNSSSQTIEGSSEPSNAQIAPDAPGQSIASPFGQPKLKKSSTKGASRQDSKFDRENASIPDKTLAEGNHKAVVNSQPPLQSLKASNKPLQHNPDSGLHNELLEDRKNLADKSSQSIAQDETEIGGLTARVKFNPVPKAAENSEFDFDRNQNQQIEESIDRQFTELKNEKVASKFFDDQIISEELSAEATPSPVEQATASSDLAISNQTANLAPQLESVPEPVSSGFSNAHSNAQMVPSGSAQPIAVTSKQPNLKKSRAKGRSRQGSMFDRQSSPMLDNALAEESSEETINSQPALQPLPASETSTRVLQRDSDAVLHSELPEDRENFVEGTSQSIAQDEIELSDLAAQVKTNSVSGKATAESSTLGFSQLQHQQIKESGEEPAAELQSRTDQAASKTLANEITPKELLLDRVHDNGVQDKQVQDRRDRAKASTDELTSAELPAEAASTQVEQEKLPEHGSATHDIEAITAAAQIEAAQIEQVASDLAIPKQAAGLAPQLTTDVLAPDPTKTFDRPVTLPLHQTESIHPIDHDLVPTDQISHSMHEAQHSMHEAEHLASAAEAEQLEAELGDRISATTETARTEQQAASQGFAVEDGIDLSGSPHTKPPIDSSSSPQINSLSIDPSDSSHTNSLPADDVSQAFMDTELSPQGFAVGGQVTVAGAEAGKAIDPSDTVPAMLTPGEFVINARDAQKHLPLLQQINQGGVEPIARWVDRSSESELSESGESIAEPPASGSLGKSQKIPVEEISTVADDPLFPQTSPQIPIEVSPDQVPRSTVQRQRAPQPFLTDVPTITDRLASADSGFVFRSLQSSALADNAAPVPSYATPPLIFRSKAPAVSASASAFSSIADWSSVEDLLGDSESAASSDWSGAYIQRMQVQPPQGFAEGGEVMAPTSAPTSRPIATAGATTGLTAAATAAIASTDQPADSATAEAAGSDLEALAQEIYQRLCWRLEIERERCGVYSGRSPW